MICTEISGGKTLFDGGGILEGWERWGNLWRVSFPADLIPEMLFRNGKAMERGRWPVNASCHADGKRTENSLTCNLPPEILKLDPVGLELVMYYDWVCRRCRITDWDENGIRFQTDGCKVTNGYKTSFCIENLPPELLAENQWYRDDRKKMIYYRGDPPNSHHFEYATEQVLLVLDGARDLTFQNAVFRNGGDASLINSNQAEAALGGAVILKNSENCRFVNCIFEQIPGWAVEIGGNCRNIVFENCIFRELGAGGIKITGEKNDPTGHNIIRNSLFNRGGRRWAGAVALLVRHSAHNTITGNEITQYHYSGISCGWVWGYAENLSHHNRISNNYIHDLGTEKLVHDAGAIYLLGIQPGTVVGGNHIARISGDCICWGIYLDEGSSEILVEHNLVHDVNNECVHLHYGRNNKICENVLIASPDSFCVSSTRGTMDIQNHFEPEAVAFELTGNLMIASGDYPFYVRYLLEIESKEGIESWRGDHNVFIRTTGRKQSIFAEDYHTHELTFRSVLDVEFIRGREENSIFLELNGPPLPEAIDGISGEVRAIYNFWYMNHRRNID